MAIEKGDGSNLLGKPLTELTTPDVNRIIELTGARNRGIGQDIDSGDSASLYLEHRGFYVTIHKKYWEDEQSILELTVIGGPRTSVLMHNPIVETTDDSVVFTERLPSAEDGKTNINATLTMTYGDLKYKFSSPIDMT